jgi:hypothetical protein
MIENNIRPASNFREWQEFRDKYLYNIEVNDVLQANLEILKKIYNIYTNT